MLALLKTVSWENVKRPISIIGIACDSAALGNVTEQVPRTESIGRCSIRFMQESITTNTRNVCAVNTTVH